MSWDIHHGSGTQDIFTKTIIIAVHMSTHRRTVLHQERAPSKNRRAEVPAPGQRPAARRHKR